MVGVRGEGTQSSGAYVQAALLGAEWGTGYQVRSGTLGHPPSFLAHAFAHRCF